MYGWIKINLKKKGSRFAPAFYRALAVASFWASGTFSAAWSPLCIPLQLLPLRPDRAGLACGYGSGRHNAKAPERTGY